MAKARVGLDDVLKNRLSANGHHWFGNNIGVFSQAGTKTASQQDYFHKLIPVIIDIRQRQALYFIWVMGYVGDVQQQTLWCV